MTSRILTIAVLVLFGLLLVADPAWATPLGKVTTVFDDVTKLFLTRIIPVLAVCIIAWNGVMIAMGRKTLMDSIVVIGGAAMALMASVIVGYLQTGAS